MQAVYILYIRTGIQLSLVRPSPAALSPASGLYFLSPDSHARRRCSTGWRGAAHFWRTSYCRGIRPAGGNIAFRRPHTRSRTVHWLSAGKSLSPRKRRVCARTCVYVARVRARLYAREVANALACKNIYLLDIVGTRYKLILLTVSK